MNMQKILSLDPGTLKTGLVVLVNSLIQKGDTMENEAVFSLIDEWTLLNQDANQLTIVYEDIRPYQCQLNMATIDTIKVIGRLEYVLRQRRIDFVGISRNEIKAFVFNRCYGLLVEDVMKKIRKKKHLNKDGSERAPSFHYVDDRMIVKSMREIWGIKKPNPGKRDELGIKDHAWQALAVATCYLNRLERAASGIF
jgi:hypothetical protein